MTVRSDQSRFTDAANAGNIAMMRALHAAGNVDIRYNNDSALRLASEGGHYLAVKWLVAMGADVQVNNNLCLRMALRQNHVGVAEYLLLKGADLSSHDLCEDMPAVPNLKVYQRYSSMGIKLALRAGVRFDKMTYQDFITLKEERVSDIFDFLQAHIVASDFAKRPDILQKVTSQPHEYRPAKSEIYKKQFACNTNFMSAYDISYQDALVYKGDIRGLCDHLKVRPSALNDVLKSDMHSMAEFTITDALYRAGHLGKVFDHSMWRDEPQAETLAEEIYTGLTTAGQKQCNVAYEAFKTEMATRRLSNQTRARQKIHRPRLG